LQHRRPRAHRARLRHRCRRRGRAGHRGRQGLQGRPRRPGARRQPGAVQGEGGGMKWTKRGRIYAPDGRLSWARKYAFPPTPLLVNDRVLRMYVAFCDENTVGRIGYVELDADDPSRVLRVSPEPVLDIGEPGAFDENGLLPTSLVPVGERLYLYYVGYQLGHR